MSKRPARWSHRPTLDQIKEVALQKVRDYQQALQNEGLPLPKLPPLNLEEFTLTLTPLLLRPVPNLNYQGKKLAGMLDIAQAEILYEANASKGRQNFTIAHELGHYFLHYVPNQDNAETPRAFFREVTPSLPGIGGNIALFFRCEESDISERNNEPDLAELSRLITQNPAAASKIPQQQRQKEEFARTELEANWFAGNLLAPRIWLTPLYEAYGDNYPRIARELDISVEAVRARLEILGMVPKLGGGFRKTNKTSPAPKDLQQGTLFDN